MHFAISPLTEWLKKHFNSYLGILIRQVIIPCSIYLCFFTLYTWPWIPHFSDAFFGDSGDGLQNAWNIWWINHAVGAHLNPWFTDYLHFPYGTTLLGHTLSPINGFFDIPLLHLFSLVQVYNVDIIGSFMFSGLTAFWLCRSISKSYIGGLLGGFAFTFSSYHFAHAMGHMNLITLQWVPLFILMWWHLLIRPNYLTACIAALALTGIVLSDFYYLLFVVLAATVMALYIILTKQLLASELLFWKCFGLFILLSLFFAAPLPLAVIISNLKDPFIGAHNPKDFGADLPSIFIPGEIWRFGSLTHRYWQHNYLGTVEGSVSIGTIPMLAFGYALFMRNKLLKNTAVWLWLSVVFAVLSLGPILHFLGKSHSRIPLPYALIDKIFPPLELAGVAARMIIVTILACAVLLAVVIGKFPGRLSHRITFLGIVFLLIFIEAWPIPLAMTPAKYPQYISFLKSQPMGAVLDNKDTNTFALYYATAYEKPMTFGYISRYPTSVNINDNAVNSVFSKKDYHTLSSKWHVRYIINDSTNPLDAMVIYKDTDAFIYDISNN